MEKIYKLLTVCNDTNFELAYQLSKNVKDFNLHGFLRYGILNNKLGLTDERYFRSEIHDYYIKKHKYFHDSIFKYYHKPIARKFYRKKIEEINKDTDINIVLHNSYNSEAYYGFDKTINDESYFVLNYTLTYVGNNKHRDVGECKIYYKITDNHATYDSFKFKLVVNSYERIETFSDYDLIVEALEKTKKVIQLLISSNIVEDYCKLKEKDTLPLLGRYKIVKQIYDLLDRSVIERLETELKYEKLINDLTDGDFPLIFKSKKCCIHNVTINSYNKKRNTVNCEVNKIYSNRSYKHRNLELLFKDGLKDLIKLC